MYVNLLFRFGPLGLDQFIAVGLSKVFMSGRVSRWKMKWFNLVSVGFYLLCDLRVTQYWDEVVTLSKKVESPT